MCNNIYPVAVVTAIRSKRINNTSALLHDCNDMWYSTVLLLVRRKIPPPDGWRGRHLQKLLKRRKI